MGHFEEVIKTLKRDMKQKGLSKVADDMRLPLIEGVITVSLLNESYELTENKIEKNGKEAGEVESLIILNAALSQGDYGISSEWKSYEKFLGTRGHVLSFKKTVEGTLARIADRMVEKKESIAYRYNARMLDNAGGADLSFTFAAFSNVRFFCQLYLEDEEFPAEAKIYFSANADKFMPALCFEKLAALWVGQLQSLVER